MTLTGANQSTQI